NPQEFENFVVELFNDRGEDKPWKVLADVVRNVAQLLTFGSGQTVARTVALLEHLQPKEQHAWDLAWGMHAEALGNDMQAVVSEFESQKPRSLPAGDAAQLKQLAFGACVGLVREQGTDAQQAQQANLPAIIRIRQSALARVVAIAQGDPAYSVAA